ncbi:MAG: methionine biosynthesis protein MetW [Promethearchaeia archaeon]
MLLRTDLKIIYTLIEPNSKVLDLGCGEGVLLYELTENKQIEGLGIEISIERIKKCMEYGVSVVQEDLNKGLKDFKKNSFDYVILSQTLEEIAKPVYLIKEMMRVGRKCIISFENLAYWKNRIRFLFTGSLRGNNSKGNNSKKDFLYNNKKQQLLSINKFLRFCEYKDFIISKEIYLNQDTLNFGKIFPNFFCKTSIFVLKGKE